MPGILDKFLQTHILSQIGLSLGNALTVPRNDLRLWVVYGTIDFLLILSAVAHGTVAGAMET